MIGNRQGQSHSDHRIWDLFPREFRVELVEEKNQPIAGSERYIVQQPMEGANLLKTHITSMISSSPYQVVNVHDIWHNR